jgi:DNA-binding transcriptional LysR family regulator
MDTRQLKSLLAIAEHGSFSRAAESVHLTVSAVSQQVRALEQEVGARLFDRSTRPPQLTIAGQQLLEAARELVRTADNAVEAISGRSVTGTLTLGSVRTSALSLLPRAIVRLNEIYPDLRIKLRVSMSESLLQEVVAARLDAAMVADQLDFPSMLSWRPFLQEPLFLAAPPGTALADAQAMLGRLPYIRFRANVPLARMIDLELAKIGGTTSEIAEIDNIASITACVANGLGISVLPKIAIDECAAPLACVPFGRPQLQRQIGLVTKTNGARQVLISKLHTLLLDLANSPEMSEA